MIYKRLQSKAGSQQLKVYVACDSTSSASSTSNAQQNVSRSIRTSPRPSGAHRMECVANFSATDVIQNRRPRSITSGRPTCWHTNTLSDLLSLRPTVHQRMRVVVRAILADPLVAPHVQRAPAAADGEAAPTHGIPSRGRDGRRVHEDRAQLRLGRRALEPSPCG